MSAIISEFGDRKPGIDYMVRPGSYGLVFNDDNQLLVVLTSTGFHLPGGGREGIETSEENLRRELQEECGMEAGNVHFVTKAVQYLHAADEGYFKKICDYYLVETSSHPSEVEEDHAMQWLTTNEALNSLSHESHRFGLQAALDKIN